METKQLRENRKMRTLTLVAAALLVVLAGSGFANAAIVTLTIDLTSSTLNNIGDSTTYKVYGVVSDNDWYDSTNMVTLHGGLALFKTGVDYTGTGLATGNNVLGTSNAKNSVAAPFVVGKTAGNLVNSAHVVTVDGTGGTIGTAGGISLWDFGDEYLTDPAPWEYGNAATTGRVLLYTGYIRAVANGTVTLTTVGVASSTQAIGLAGSGMMKTLTTTIVNGSAVLTIGVANHPPTIGTISPAAILEADWTKEPGWNNLAHKVIPDIKVTGSSDPDSDPLTYDWTISKPGGGSKVLSAHGDTIVGLSLSELQSLGLPDWTGPGGAYLWQLSVVANDGKVGGVSSPSASIDVFVPEPATIGLLGFGIVALLRRRRA